MIFLFFAVMVTGKETFCPPPMKRFLRINDKIFRNMNGATIHMNEVPQEEVLRLTLRNNSFYSSLKCSLLETQDGKGFTYFGVREEYDLQSFSKKQECQVYLARQGLGQQRVELSVMLVTSVMAGVSSECQPELSTRLSLTVSFCAEEWSCDDTVDHEPEIDYEYVIENSEGDMDVCPGEWGCVPVVTTNTPDLGSVMDVTEIEIVADADRESATEPIGDNDVVATIYNALMSETMTPVTMSLLVLIGFILLFGMWCLTCRNRNCLCCESKKSMSSHPSAVLSSVSIDKKDISGPFTRENSPISSHPSSTRSSLRSVGSVRGETFDNCEKKEERHVTTRGEDKSNNRYHPQVTLVNTRSKLFTLAEEIGNSEKEFKIKSLPRSVACDNPLLKQQTVDIDSLSDGSRRKPISWTITHENTTLPDTTEDDYEIMEPQYQIPTFKLPSIVANSYKEAQKDLPKTFY